MKFILRKDFNDGRRGFAVVPPRNRTVRFADRLHATRFDTREEAERWQASLACDDGLIVVIAVQDSDPKVHGKKK